MTPDEYVVVLQQRQAEAWDGTGLPPLLEWMVRPGDELLFTPPEAPPPRERAPRRRRSVESLRAERDRLAARRGRLGRPMSDDPATARVSPALAARGAARLDRDAAEHQRLTDRIAGLDVRIGRSS